MPADDDEPQRLGESAGRASADYLNTHNITPEDLAANPEIRGRSNGTAPWLSPAWPSYSITAPIPDDWPGGQYAPISIGCGAVTTTRGSSATRIAPREDRGKWAHASFDLTIPALDRPRTVRVEFGDGTHSDHSVITRSGGGDPFHVPVQRWYPDAYDPDIDFGQEGPIIQRMELKAYDVDDGGSHYAFFVYDAQPAGLA